MNYTIIKPSRYTGIFYAITANDQAAIAQAFDEAWAKRIVTALELLDLHEKDHPVESYIGRLRGKVGDEGK